MKPEMRDTGYIGLIISCLISDRTFGFTTFISCNIFRKALCVARRTRGQRTATHAVKGSKLQSDTGTSRPHE